MARVAWRRSSNPKALASSGSPVLSRGPIATMLRKNSLSSCFLTATLSGLSAFAVLSLPAAAQTTDVNDVHVQPREIEKPKDAPPKALVSPTNGLSAHVRPLKVDVDLVLVPVTITDPMNRLVTGLEKENFQLYEGNSSQDIRSFSAEDARFPGRDL